MTAAAPTRKSPAGVRARARTVNKAECCRSFGWTRYQFDKNAAAGMPVVEAARHKGGEWRVDLRAVARWICEEEEREAARRRRYREREEERRRELDCTVAAMSEARRRLILRGFGR